MGAVTTKTETRRQTIKRGTSRGAKLGERALARAAVAEIRGAAEPNLGADTVAEIQAEQARAESMAAEQYREPDSAAAETVRSWPLDDPRRVPLGVLLAELRRRVKTWTRGYSRDERGDIATDALILLIRWTEQGEKEPLQLGAAGELPLRRDWLTDGLPSARAGRAMRAAILQAARDRNSDAEHVLARAESELDAEPTDTESGELSLAAQALREHERSSDRAPVLPDTDSAELLADVLGVTLTAARALIARGYRMESRRCSELWNVSEQRAADILSRGAAEIRKRWPDGRELIDALAAAAPELRERLATRAYLAVRELAAAPSWHRADALAAAETAVNEWRAASGELPFERRAVELAAARVGWFSESIAPAAHLRRLLAAEQGRARVAAARGAHGSAPSGRRSSASTAPLSRFRRVAELEPERPSELVGAELRCGYGDGYSGACSCLYLYRRGGRR